MVLDPRASPEKPRTTQQAVLLPRPGSLGDAFLGVIALVALIGGGFLLSGGSGRTVEFLAATGFVALAYGASWRAGRLVAAGGVLVFLALEFRYDRLDGTHYWEEALFATAIGGSALAAAYVRLTADERRVGLLDAQAALDHFEETAATGIGIRNLPPLEYELERARRHTHQVSLLVLRLDGLDDLEAHTDEETLQELHDLVDRILVRQLRSTDIAFRDDSAEHWVILPHTTPLDARGTGERLRLALATEPVDAGPARAFTPTISIGIASFPADGTTNDEVVRAVRSAYAHAVELGGNRSVLYSASESSPPGWALTVEAAL